MASETYDFGVIDRLGADAVGLPGQRTFRLRFLNERGEGADLWIEKEQMQALGQAIEQLLAQLSDDPFIDLVSNEPEKEEPNIQLPFPQPPTVEFKVGRLALGYDEGKGRFALLIHDIEEEQEGAPDFRCLVTREQLKELSKQIDTVVKAGRPRCPLCETPLTPGVAHFCPPSNGHARVQLEDEG
ncbi:hypothetical protein Tter_0754 [Thermobaculum terrenum ATCC BAA-798]|uniref:DUF3090 family protein n=1 Tax=Thermobaculum terrenum (strain ATCC BAA-798 / CCMEE 7001 / YNP1) TaxID=525904 RepID=D1CFG5_THET1|nr:DUF3090 domain-containing protein [Thermobaculum terrenum]ACZ41671.1 hypothetical protein Tter_0754 [Thermobaculum terrenum ATCC BAA-798]